MYFPFFILHGWRKRSAIQTQTIYSEFPYIKPPKTSLLFIRNGGFYAGFSSGILPQRLRHHELSEKRPNASHHPARHHPAHPLFGGEVWVQAVCIREPPA